MCCEGAVGLGGDTYRLFLEKPLWECFKKVLFFLRKRDNLSLQKGRSPSKFTDRVPAALGPGSSRPAPLPTCIRRTWMLINRQALAPPSPAERVSLGAQHETGSLDRAYECCRRSKCKELACWPPIRSRPLPKSLLVCANRERLVTDRYV